MHLLTTLKNIIWYSTVFSISGSVSEEISGSEDGDIDPEDEGRQRRRKRKRREISPVVFDRSSGASDSEHSSYDSSFHVKSKVAKVASKKKKRFSLNDFLDGARYFVMKSNNHENVSLSKAKVV